jgi:putative transposase
VWLYFRFPLSFREAEELMLERGTVVSYETIRRWCGKFGQTYAGALRRRRPQSGNKWHPGEVFIKINGRLQYLWRAVDQDGNVLGIALAVEVTNKRAENSHQPARQRERAMKGLRSVGGVQRFLSAFSGVSPHSGPAVI